MARENNFTKAVKELLGEKDNMDASILEEENPSADKKPMDDFKTAEKAFTPPSSTFSFGGVSASRSERSSSSSFISGATENTPPLSQQSPQPTAPHHPSVPQAATFINKETVITGSITSKTDVCNEGQVTGDIITQENVTITGKVDGNVEGNSIQIIGGYVVGNITAKTDISNDFASIIIGDITGENFSSDGKVKGNLKINSSVSLKSNAIICGNVSSRKLSVQDGAVIKGNVQILSPKATDDDTFSVPKNRLQSIDDDMFEIPKHPAAKQAEDEQEFTMPQYHTSSKAATNDLFASLKNRMLDKNDNDKTEEDDSETK